jgi:hypothetical protein
MPQVDGVGKRILARAKRKGTGNSIDRYGASL